MQGLNLKLLQCKRNAVFNAPQLHDETLIQREFVLLPGCLHKLACRVSLLLYLHVFGFGYARR